MSALNHLVSLSTSLLAPRAVYRDKRGSHYASTSRDKVGAVEPLRGWPPPVGSTWYLKDHTSVGRSLPPRGYVWAFGPVIQEEGYHGPIALVDGIAMCGRYVLYSRPPAVSLRLVLPEPEQPWTPRYNISPGTWVTAAYRPAIAGELQLGQLWWNYKPKWARPQDPEPINAKAEKLVTSGYYKHAFAHRRCLVPADGYYEWLQTPTGKQPHFICRADRALIWLAAIWMERADGHPGCAIITEPARGPAREVHDRMPLVIDDESLELWLDPDLTDRETIRAAVRHIPADLVTHWPVSRAVNRPGTEGAELIEPIST